MQKIRRIALVVAVILLALVGTLGRQSGATTWLFEGDFLGMPYAGLQDGVFSMRFAIYDSSSGGHRLWPEAALYEQHTLVIVVGGMFTVELGANGQPLTNASVLPDGAHVQIWVCQSAGFDCDAFEPVPTRLPLDGSASAPPESRMGSIVSSEAGDHDHWGETWSGDGTGLTFISSGWGMDIDTNSSKDYATAIRGQASSSTGATVGVWGVTESEDDGTVGVWGQAGNSEGMGFGVLGQTFSDDSESAGVMGTGKGGFGGLFETESYAPFIAGVKGIGKFGSAKGVFGEARGSSIGAAGVYGYASSSVGEISGVLGWAESSTKGASGVSGFANSSHGETYGVRGQTNSSEGYGVYGLATELFGYTAGVFGKSLSELGFGIQGEGQHGGVYGLGTDISGLSHGILGRTNSTANNSSGVYGFAAAESGRTFGVYGHSSSAEGYGVYSDGNAHIQGDLTWQARKGYVSVSPAAFHPTESDVSYTNRGGSLKCHSAPLLSIPYASETFVAPVSLPHGAVVIWVEMHLYSNRPIASIARACADGFPMPAMHLVRSDFADNWVIIANVEPGGSMESNVSRPFRTSTITAPNVDNAQFTYFLRLDDMPGEFLHMYFLGVVVEYEITGPY
jgi:hypothetical protein